jgi:hypothetical protein
MLQVQEPFKALLKGFKIYGFFQSEISQRKRKLTIASFVCFGLAIWTLIVLSLVQSTSNNDFFDKFLLAVTSLSICSKAMIIFMQMDRVAILLKKFDEVVKAHDLEVELEEARKKSLRLATFHCVSTTVALVLALIASIYQGTLSAPVYEFNIINCVMNRYLFIIGWIYVAIGCLYATYLSTILDLLPIILMTILPEISLKLSSEIRKVKPQKFESFKTDIKRLTALHKDIKELILKV